jgi:hypothetical protein
MGGKTGLAIAAILLGAAPAGAQVRQMTVRRAAPPARPMVLPNRGVTYVHARPVARPPVRAVNAPFRVIHVQSQPPAEHSAPVRIPAGPGIAPPTITPSASPVYTTFGGTPISLGQLLNPAPGLGFDFTHLAAINGDLATRAIIDPLTQYQLALARSLPRVQPAAFLPAYGGGSVVVAPAQPQVIVVQQPVPQKTVAQQAVAAPVPAPTAAAPTAPPLPDVGQFLLVRRDGKVIHAVAFSEEGKRIVYITAEGMRRTIAVDQIDLKATEERNAERGTILRLTD